MKKRIAIWGATGSIGTQTLDVIQKAGDLYEVVALTAHRNVKLLLEQAKQFRPKEVVLCDPVDSSWKVPFQSLGIRVLEGREGLLELASRDDVDLVVNGLVGAVGLEATYRAIQAGVSIALANKEVLVMAGEFITQEARKRGVRLIPVDSEHSAIFQCLVGEEKENVRRILLTGSGGPFLRIPKSHFDHITVEQALAHPNWKMGKKVTVDSATLINKGLEVIEAKWLFDVAPQAIEVVVHPQSIIHSMVEFTDGSVKAQLGFPDMRIPIGYALAYPERHFFQVISFDVFSLPFLTFEPPDLDKFSGLTLAYQVLKAGGTAPVVYNAADEVSVSLFLSRQIRFSQIPQIIEECLQRHTVQPHPDLQEILETDQKIKKMIEQDILPSLRSKNQ